MDEDCWVCQSCYAGSPGLIEKLCVAGSFLVLNLCDTADSSDGVIGVHPPRLFQM